MSGYIGVNGTARKVAKWYVGVNGTAREVKRAYVGDETGKAKLVWQSGPAMATFTVHKTVLQAMPKYQEFYPSIFSLYTYDDGGQQVGYEQYIPAHQNDMTVKVPLGKTYKLALWEGHLPQIKFEGSAQSYDMTFVNAVHTDGAGMKTTTKVDEITGAFASEGTAEATATFVWRTGITVKIVATKKSDGSDVKPEELVGNQRPGLFELDIDSTLNFAQFYPGETYWQCARDYVEGAKLTQVVDFVGMTFKIGGAEYVGTLKKADYTDNGVVKTTTEITGGSQPSFKPNAVIAAEPFKNALTLYYEVDDT